jgi:hypothetical protein
MTHEPRIHAPIAGRKLDMPVMCEICGKARNKGSHDRCSKKRQAAYFAAVAAKRNQAKGDQHGK